MIRHYIQALYDPRTPIPSHPEFYEQVLEDIEYFSLHSQIYILLKQQDKLERTPPFFRDRIKHQYSKSLQQNYFIKHQSEQILNRFEAAGISAIPLKGVHFADKYFGHWGARSTSDIDLLIQAADLEQAAECIQSMGFTIEGQRIPSHFHSSYCKPLPNSLIPLSVELHWDLLTENTSAFNIEEFWSQALPLQPYNHIKELSDEHTFYMICLHGWRHAMDSLKYFIDIIQMIHTAGDAFDYSTLLRDAASHQTHKRMINTLSIVYRQFPHLDKIKPFPYQKESSLWWDYGAIRDKGLKTYKQYVNLARYQLLEYDTVKHSLAASYQYLQTVLNGRGDC